MRHACRPAHGRAGCVVECHEHHHDDHDDDHLSDHRAADQPASGGPGAGASAAGPPRTEDHDQAKHPTAHVEAGPRARAVV